MRPATSLRERSPQATWRALFPLAGSLGISRVTEITRLDRLGLPVFASVRPRGRLLRVHAGKGCTADDARVGALMEGLEFAIAEAASGEPPQRLATLAELAREWPAGLDLDRLAPPVGLALEPQRPLPVVACEALDGSAACWLPAELVQMPAPGQRVIFDWSTNGLASGNTLAEATLHALLEVLERDAVVMNGARDDSRLVDAATLPPPWAGYAERWARLGVRLHVHALPNDFGLPCFAADLHEPGSLDVNLAAGQGLHLDRGIALARAITEAAQSRLSTLHGAREDVARFFARYDDGPEGRVQAERPWLERITGERDALRFDQVPTAEVEGVEAALERVLRQLAARGFARVFRHRLRPAALQAVQAVQADRDGWHVVKVVVPGCEHLEPGSRRLGPRLRARVLARG